MKHFIKLFSVVIILLQSLWTFAAPPTNPVFSPYMYSGDYWPYNPIMTSLTTSPKTQTALSAMPANLTTLTWAFAYGTCGSESWPGGIPGATFGATNVPAFVAAGKKYIVSAGGAGQTFRCNNTGNMILYIQNYFSPNMVGMDFDIEGENQYTKLQINQLISALVAIQRDVNNYPEYSNITWSFNVGGYGGNNQSYGLAQYGQWVLEAIQSMGLKKYIISIQTLDFLNDPSHCVQKADLSGCEMGSSTNQALINVHDYYGVPYANLGVNMMIGGNDYAYDVFTLADVQTISTFALQNGIARISPWAFSRDIDCPATHAASDICNSYGTAGTLAFTNAFLTDLGISP